MPPASTPHGRRMADIALPPRLAHMVLAAAASGHADRAARIAALIVERGLGGRDTDLESRLEGFGCDRGPRARDAATLAHRWARSCLAKTAAAPLSDGLLLAEAYPERIAKARGAPGHFQLATGRGAFLEPTDRPGSRTLDRHRRTGRRRGPRPHPAGRPAGPGRTPPPSPIAWNAKTGSNPAPAAGSRPRKLEPGRLVTRSA